MGDGGTYSGFSVLAFQILLGAHFTQGLLYLRLTQHSCLTWAPNLGKEIMHLENWALSEGMDYVIWD